MTTTVLATILFWVQLTASGGALPQVLDPAYKTAAPAQAGRKTSLTVSFTVTKGYVINHTPPISLKLMPPAGLVLDKTEFSTPEKDPKSKDEYYVDLPTLKVAVTAAKAGKYEIPGTLTYFFCSKADSFCARQTRDVKIPLEVK